MSSSKKIVDPFGCFVAQSWIEAYQSGEKRNVKLPLLDLRRPSLDPVTFAPDGNRQGNTFHSLRPF